MTFKKAYVEKKLIFTLDICRTRKSPKIYL